ncbi:MAG: Hsp33 family molecular chaperone HslO [Mariprofundaceae bacterium]|nr:Hsp33 family molecular chaperone HslO [Mariprofundaceae bacterium]
MFTEKDTLIRFLLPDAHARGVIIRGKALMKQAAEIHGMQGVPALMFGRTLLASIILLSVSKGGVRQVLQLDANVENTPIKRILAECCSGGVRGYVLWQDNPEPVLPDSDGITAWLGRDMLLSTVRDTGIGRPYVSTIKHDSDWLAEHVMEYLKQSVQVQADVILQDDLAIMIEAMPGCDDAHWFKAVEAMAKVSNQSIKKDDPEVILQIFDTLSCQIVGRDAFVYQCGCDKRDMQQVLASISVENLHDLADEHGDVTLSCQYCKRTSKMNMQEGEQG